MDPEEKRIIAFTHAFCGKIKHNLTKDEIECLARETWRTLGPANKSAAPLPVGSHRLAVHLSHDCQWRVCLDQACALCEYNPHRCTSNCQRKYLIGDYIRPKCGASIRISLVDETTGAEVVHNLPNLMFQIDLVDADAYHQACVDSMFTGNFTPYIIAPPKDPHGMIQPLLAGDGVIFTEPDRRARLRPTQGHSFLSCLKCTTSSQTLLAGKGKPVMLLVRLVEMETGLMLPHIRPAVSEPFVVATQRTKSALKADIPKLADPVEKLECIGRSKKGALQNLSQLNVPPDLLRVETVAQYKKLLQMAEDSPAFKRRLLRELNFSPEDWAKSAAHAAKAVPLDFRPRLWWCSHSRLGLLFTSEDAGVKLDQPMALLKGVAQEQQQQGQGQELVAATGAAAGLGTVVLLPIQRDTLFQGLLLRARQAWTEPGHPGWAICWSDPQDPLAVSQRPMRGDVPRLSGLLQTAAALAVARLEGQQHQQQELQVEFAQQQQQQPEAKLAQLHQQQQLQVEFAQQQEPEAKLAQLHQQQQQLQVQFAQEQQQSKAKWAQQHQQQEQQPKAQFGQQQQQFLAAVAWQQQQQEQQQNEQQHPGVALMLQQEQRPMEDATQQAKQQKQPQGAKQDLQQQQQQQHRVDSEEGQRQEVSRKAEELLRSEGWQRTGARRAAEEAAEAEIAGGRAGRGSARKRRRLLVKLGGRCLEPGQTDVAPFDRLAAVAAALTAVEGVTDSCGAGWTPQLGWVDTESPAVVGSVPAAEGGGLDAVKSTGHASGLHGGSRQQQPATGEGVEAAAQQAAAGRELPGEGTSVGGVGLDVGDGAVMSVEVPADMACGSATPFGFENNVPPALKAAAAAAAGACKVKSEAGGGLGAAASSCTSSRSAEGVAAAGLCLGWPGEGSRAPVVGPDGAEPSHRSWPYPRPGPVEMHAAAAAARARWAQAAAAMSMSGAMAAKGAVGAEMLGLAAHLQMPPMVPPFYLGPPLGPSSSLCSDASRVSLQGANDPVFRARQQLGLNLASVCHEQLGLNLASVCGSVSGAARPLSPTPDP